nr:MAG TPA: hypothetical protein [Caudoviricetes sp.]
MVLSKAMSITLIFFLDLTIFDFYYIIHKGIVLWVKK